MPHKAACCSIYSKSFEGNRTCKTLSLSFNINALRPLSFVIQNRTYFMPLFVVYGICARAVLTAALLRAHLCYRLNHIALSARFREYTKRYGIKTLLETETIQ